MPGLASQVCLLKSSGEWTRETGSSLFPEMDIRQHLREGKVQPERDFEFTVISYWEVLSAKKWGVGGSWKDRGIEVLCLQGRPPGEAWTEEVGSILPADASFFASH